MLCAFNIAHLVVVGDRVGAWSGGGAFGPLYGQGWQASPDASSALPPPRDTPLVGGPGEGLPCPTLSPYTTLGICRVASVV